MSISKKLTFYVAATVAVVVFLAIWYLSQFLSNITTRQTYDQAHALADYYSLSFQKSIERSQSQLTALQLQLHNMMQAGNASRDLVHDSLIGIIESNPEEYLGAWTQWEPNAFDGKDVEFANKPFNDHTGRLNAYWHWNDTGEIVYETNENWQTASWYQKPKKLLRPVLLDPYWYQVSGKNHLMISLIHPVIVNGEFKGAIGIDFKLKHIQANIEKVDILQGSSAMLIANDGKIITGNDSLKLSEQIRHKIKLGQRFNQPIQNGDIKEHVIFTPINITGTQLPWSLAIAIPEEVLNAPGKMLTILTFSVGVLILLLVVAIVVLITHNLVARPLKLFIGKVNQLGSANFNTKVNIATKDEFGQLATEFNNMVQELNNQRLALLNSQKNIKRINQSLEYKISERTIKLREANNFLQLEMKKAQQSNQAKSNFLANMSHEIRTPLNGIIGSHYVLSTTKLNAEQEDLVQGSLSSAYSLLAILSDILDFSKIEAGKLTVEESSTGINDVIEKLVHLNAPIATDKAIEFDIQLDPQLPQTIMTDGGRLAQILLNLTSNALKFTEKGWVLLSVKKQNNRIVFKVKDSGIGMTQEQCQRLFKPFEQAEQSITRKYGGTGLGLSIAKQLTELLGGTLTVNSEKNKGTEFVLTLPIHKASKETIVDTNASVCQQIYVLTSKINYRLQVKAMAAMFNLPVQIISGIDQVESSNTPKCLIVDDSALRQLTEQDKQAANKTFSNIVTIASKLLVDPTNTEHNQSLSINNRLLCPLLPKPFINAIKLANEAKIEVAPEQQSNSILTGLSILLVDDVEMNRKVVQRMLDKRGCIIDTATNGQQAVEKVEQQIYDLILMDVHMPIMDGYEATRIIKSQSRFSTLPIVGLTADVLESSKAQCLDSGMAAYMTKPFRPEQLITIIEKLAQQTNEISAPAIKK